MQLDPIAVAAGVRLEALATVGSTNKEARLRAQRGEAAPLWITAVSRPQGRGRMDRSWASPPGNLYASLLLREPAPPERAPELGFVAALALRDAIIAEAAGARVAACLQMAERSVAGRQEMRRHFDRRRRRPGQSRLNAVIGIGVNCASHPPDTAYPATDLASHGAAIAPERLFRAAVRRRCAGALRMWDRGAGFLRYSRRLAVLRERPRRGDHRAQWLRRKARPLCRARSIGPACSADTARRRYRKNIGGRRVSPR